MTVRSILADDSLKRELDERLAPAVPGGSFLGIVGGFEARVSKRALRDFLAGPAPEQLAGVDVREAIVRRFGRPSLLVKDHSVGYQTIQDPESQVWSQRLKAALPAIEAVVPSVGRIAVQELPGYSWVGTGWLVSTDVVVTNRHVAQAFAYRKGAELGFRRLAAHEQRVRASVDFRQEYDSDEENEYRIIQLLLMEEEDGPDLALLRVHPQSTLGQPLPDPVPLSPKRPTPGQDIAVIGYPARDGHRNDPLVMEQIFGDVYDKKRLGPGKVLESKEQYFTHDCTTLGGNSGSLVIDLTTGHAVGLHFAGSYLDRNYAVPTDQIKAALSRLNAAK
jgi:endonuclease G